MELSDYDLMFIHIKGNNNILADGISGLKTQDIYKEPLDNPKTSDTLTCNAEMVSSDIQTKEELPLQMISYTIAPCSIVPIILHEFHDLRAYRHSMYI